MFKRERDHPTGSTEPTGSTQSKDQTVPTEPTEPTEQQQKQPKTLLEKVYKITVPVDDDTCGKELAGTSFQATLVHYHVEAKAWVIRHIHTGAHYFVNHEFFTEPVRTEPRLTPVKERRAMQVLFQPGAKTDLGEDVGGKNKKTHVNGELTPTVKELGRMVICCSSLRMTGV